MLIAYRRYFGPLIYIFMLIPLIGQFVVGSEGTSISAQEQRPLAAKPSFPRSLKEWDRFPAAINAYSRDHFGFRQAMIDAHVWLTQVLFGHEGDAQVLPGANGWLFFRGNQMLAQSAGRLIRRESIASTADFLTKLKEALGERKIRLLVASPPNSSTVYNDMIPGWPNMNGRQTETDLLMAELSQRGVQNIDLRPILVAARTDGLVYFKHDTHWTARGALAAFNALATATGHTDCHFAPEAALGFPARVMGGDLARMIGVAAEVSETVELFNGFGTEAKVLSESPKVLEYVGNRAPIGRTLMVIGDSFTDSQFGPLIAACGLRAIWLPHQSCAFRWEWIETFHPDEVWYVPTERLQLCQKASLRTKIPDTRN